MHVILLERIRKLGQMGDVVTVKDGFARNYLLPYGKALRATDANLQRFESEKTQLEARNLELKSEAEAVAKKVDGNSFLIIRQASDTGQLFGSVATRDIAEAVTQGGTAIERRQILLLRPIKTLGLHPITIGLHPEVDATVTVNVARSEEEAGRQERGEDILTGEIEDQEEAKVAAEEVFEDDERAKDAEQALQEDGAEGEAPADAEAEPAAVAEPPDGDREPAEDVSEPEAMTGNESEQEEQAAAKAKSKDRGGKGKKKS
jgi:large subunit ribosomal protein L9